MKIKPNVKFLQEGGAMPSQPTTAPTSPAEGAGQPQGQGEDPIVMLAEMATQALQNNDGQMALQVCQAFLQLVQQMAGGEAGTEGAPQGEPVYAKGGKLVYRIKD